MPDASQSILPYIILLIAALGSFIAAAGLIYWAIHNSAKGVREEMREGDRLLREEMRAGFHRLEDLLLRHQHDSQGYPYVTSRQGDND